MRTRALWRFDETKNEQRPIDAIGAVAELGQSPIEFGTAEALRQAIGWGKWSHGWHNNVLAGNIPGAFGGVNLVPGGTPVYGASGPRPLDKAIRFDTNTEFFNGGNILNVAATTSLCLAWTGFHGAGLAADAILASKINAVGQWKLWRHTAGFVVLTLNDGVDNLDVTANVPIGSWYAGMAIAERGATEAKIATCALGGVPVVGGAGSLAAIGDCSGVANFQIGASSIGNFCDVDFKCGSFFAGASVDAATGMSANLGTALSNFVAAIMSTPAVVDAAAGRGRSFIALSGHGLEGADVVSGSTLLTRDCSVQALVRWDLKDQAASTLWTLTKTGGSGAAYDAGASSVETFAGDGHIEIVVGDVTQSRFFGLSLVDANVDFSSIDYAIRYDQTDYSVYEGGAVKLVIVGLVAGDVLRIERTGTTVRYKRNGVTYYTSLVPSAGPLRADVSLLNVNVTLENIQLVDANARKAITWQNLTNTSATPTENIAGTLYARGKASGAAEYLGAGLELRVSNAAIGVGELRWLWQDAGGVLKRQVGGYFAPPTDGSYIMLTATRRWVSSNKVVLRYFLGDRMLGEVESVDGSIGGGTTGTTTVGARFDGTKYLDFFDGVIDELRVVDYELAPEEIAATWARITKYQPRGYELLKQMHPPGFPISEDPSSRVQRETNMWGQALGYAAAQGENLRNALPDTAYGETQEEWEQTVGVSPKALDDLDTRRARVIGRLRQRAGVSIPGIREATKDLVGTNPDNLELVAFAQEVVEGYDRPAVWSTGEGVRIVKTGATGAFDAGASSVQTIDADGYVEFAAPATTADQTIGLSDADANVTEADILFGFRFTSAAVLRVRESGLTIVDFGAASYAAGDVFRIERRGTAIRYYQNGVLKYTSLVASTGALRVDSSLFTNGGTLSNIRLIAIEDTKHREIGLDWQNVTLATVTPARFVPFRDGYLKKSAGVDATWDAGASSVETFAGDGYVETTVVETNKYRMLGLSAVDANANFNTIAYGLQLDEAPTLSVYENGVFKGTFGAFAAGDVLRVERVGTTVYYKRNGAIIYTSLAPSSGELRIDTSFFRSAGTLQGVKLVDAGARLAITWQGTQNVQAYADATRVQGANAEDLQLVSSKSWRAALQVVSSAPQFKTQAADPANNRYATAWGAHLRTKIEPIAIPNRGEVGIALHDDARNTTLLFGLRNDAGTYRIITERVVDGVSQGAVNRAVSALTAHWLRLFVEAPSPVIGGVISDTTWNFSAAWSTAGATSGFTTYAGIAHAARFQWAVLYARSFGGTLTGALDAYFDETRLFTPYGDRSLRFFAFRNPALAGAVDVLGANAVVRGLKHAHTEAALITSKELLYDTDGHTYDYGPLGGY